MKMDTDMHTNLQFVFYKAYFKTSACCEGDSFTSCVAYFISLWKLLPLITAEVWERMTLKMILAARNTQRFALTTEGMENNGADLISTP